MIRVFAINLGSSSSKVAYSEDGELVYKESIYHTKEEFEGCTSFFEQEPIRLARIVQNMEEHGVDLNRLDAIVARGGMLQPLPVGVFQINSEMLDQVRSGKYGMHPSSLGLTIANELTMSTNALAFTADVPSSDEMLPIARFSGLKEVLRRTMTQTLNARACVREWTESIGKNYEDVNVITTGLGGGINTIAHCHGRMIDTNNSVNGEGCFSTNRCLTVPIDELIKECYSGEYTYDEMCWHVNGDAGLKGYLGTIDMLEITQRIENGDTYADQVIDAMCYQIAKDIGAFATTMCGDVDAIFLAGGMANSPIVTERVRKRVEWIAPVIVRPGELEMEALLENGYKALTGDIPVQRFCAAETNREAMERIDEMWSHRDWTFER